MNEMTKMDEDTGEIITLENNEQSLVVQMAQAELNQAVTTARAFPRSIPRAVKNIMSLATIDQETSTECVYALPRGGKPIKGPSVRFAEIIASQYGNCHVGSRVVAVDKFEKVVIAEGVFFDLETGMKRTAQIRRRISGKDGRLFNEDMITMVGNAAASIAMREAILKGVPRAIWRRAYEQCVHVIAGDVETLSVRRDKAMTAFAAFGVTPEQIFASLEVESIDDVSLDHVATLTTMYRAIKAGEQSPEDYFPTKASKEDAKTAAKGTAAKLNEIAKGAETNGKAITQAADEGSGDDANEASGDDAAAATADDNDQAESASGAEESAPAAAASAPTEDEVNVAYRKGVADRVKGVARTAMPRAYLADGKEPLADAWLEGWSDEAKKIKATKGTK